MKALYQKICRIFNRKSSKRVMSTKSQHTATKSNADDADVNPLEVEIDLVKKKDETVIEITVTGATASPYKMELSREDINDSFKKSLEILKSGGKI